MNHMIEELNDLTRETAAKVMNYATNIELPQYHQFLDMMYHYTRHSGNRLEHGSKMANSANIKQLFNELAIDEAHHYRLAQSDLSMFGLSPSETTPKIVQDFHQFWFDIEAEAEMTYVGSMYVLENIANYLGSQVKQRLLDLNIEAKQARFILIHLEADEDHGRRLRELSQNCDQSAIPYLLRGAVYSSAFFIKMHQEAFASAQTH